MANNTLPARRANGRFGDLLTDIYDRLYSAFGPQNWWPADTPFEVCVGAILTQNTSWSNVARCIAGLKERGLMEPAAMYELSQEELSACIRPAGYYNLKAGRLRSFLSALVEQCDSKLELLFGGGLEEARQRLLAIRGIGPETADSMLLYAGGRPTFVVDAYTMRALLRHSITWEDAGYDDVRDFFMENLLPDPALFNEYHALWVSVGKEFCRKGRPRCDGCPLQGI